MERYPSTCDGQQYVGRDLHRLRTVIVRTSAEGELLEAVRIANDADTLAEVLSRVAGKESDASKAAGAAIAAFSAKGNVVSQAKATRLLKRLRAGARSLSST